MQLFLWIPFGTDTKPNVIISPRFSRLWKMQEHEDGVHLKQGLNLDTAWRIDLEYDSSRIVSTKCDGRCYASLRRWVQWVMPNRTSWPLPLWFVVGVKRWHGDGDKGLWVGFEDECGFRMKSCNTLMWGWCEKVGRIERSSDGTNEQRVCVGRGDSEYLDSILPRRNMCCDVSFWIMRRTGLIPRSYLQHTHARLDRVEEHGSRDGLVPPFRYIKECVRMSWHALADLWLGSTMGRR